MEIQEWENSTLNTTMVNYNTRLSVVLGINIVVCIIGAITNTTAFLVFKKSRPGSTMINMLLFLSVAEVILALSAGITAALQLLDSRSLARSIFSDVHFAGLTVRNLWVAFIAFKRWDATARPLRPLIRGCSKANMAKILAALYLFCSVMVCLVYTGLVPKSYCGIFIFYFWYIMVSHGLTFALITIFGILTVIKSGSMTRYTGSDSMRPSLRKRQRAVTKTIVTLLVTFLVCEVTFFCIYTLYYQGFCGDQSYVVNPLTFHIGYMLTDVDSICNFIIYCFCYASFRRRLQSCKSCFSGPDSPMVSQSVQMRGSTLFLRSKHPSTDRDLPS